MYSDQFTPDLEKSKQIIPQESIPPVNNSTKSLQIITLILTGMFIVSLGASVYLYTRMTALQKQVQELTVVEQMGTTSVSTPASQPNEAQVSIPKGWLTYQEPLSGLSFAYPSTVTLNPKGHLAESEASTTLTVTAQPMGELEDFPLGFTKEVAFKDQESLQAGQYGEHIDFALPESEQVFTFSDGVGKTYTVLSQLDVCDVKFMRKLIIYHNDIQVILSYRGPQSLIQNSLEYYQIDEANCGDAKIWKPGNLFYSNLLTKQHSQPVQEWYDTFDAILLTLRFR